MVKQSIVIASAIFLAACSPIPKQIINLDMQASCCADKSKLEFQSADWSKKVEKNISVTSPVFEFEEGKSHYTALALPDRKESSTALVKTYMMGRHIKQWQYVLCPHITLLDENKQELPNPVDEIFQFQPPGFISALHWYKKVQLPPEAKYIAIHTATSTRGKKFRLPYNDIGIPSCSGNICVSSVGEPSPLPCGPTGKISIELK